MIKPIELSVVTDEGNYPIHIGENLLHDQKLLEKFIKSKEIMIVSNPTVAQHYLAALRNVYTSYQCDYCLLPDGEAYKNLSSWQGILDNLVTQKHHRDTTIIALGGGVVGDMAGFAAACYQRGVAFLQMPTSLLAQVDAAIGGKTGVNHVMGKNLIGAFHQPQAVIIDLKTLATLPDREYRAGIAEIIKIALICDQRFFCELEQKIAALLAREPLTLQYVVARACALKISLIAKDVTETAEQRILLNLGHTFAHAIEQALGFEHWLHGEAVAVGLMAAAKLSEIYGYLEPALTQRIHGLLHQAHLPTTLPPESDQHAIFSAIKKKKKILSKQIRFILLRNIGEAMVSDTVTHQNVLHVLRQLGCSSSNRGTPTG